MDALEELLDPMRTANPENQMLLESVKAEVKTSEWPLKVLARLDGLLSAKDARAINRLMGTELSYDKRSRRVRFSYREEAKNALGNALKPEGANNAKP